MATKQRKRKRAGSQVPHLVWRGRVAYWSRRHPMLPTGRVVRSLETKHDKPELATTYAGALNVLCDRGDWNVVRRWAEGAVHISEIARAVREGDYSRLSRLNITGTLLGPACDDFLTRSRATLRKGSVKRHASHFQQLRDAWGDDFPMASATSAHCEAFLHAPKASIGDEPWAAKTQGTVRAQYAELWKFVIQREAEEAEQQGAMPSVTKNPWTATKAPRLKRTRFAFLTPADWAKLEQLHAKTPVMAVLALGIMGLRRGEIQHLRSGVDIVFEPEPLVHVQGRTGKLAWEPKTGNSIRTLPVPDALLPILAYHAEHYAGTFFVTAERDTGKPISDGAITAWARTAFKAAGLKYGREAGDSLTLHSLRHTCATWMLSAGVPLPTVAEWIGDTQQEVLKTYGHALPNDRGKALKAMERALGK
jgi:integrase